MSHIASSQVVIIVEDLDDNKPKFESSLVPVGVRVDAPLQTEVVTVTAVDADPTAPPIRWVAPSSGPL